MKVPYIPDAAPFNEDQRAWLSGFLAGLHSRAALAGHAAVAVPEAAAAQEVVKLDILFGTQTGNAESVAQDAARTARGKGFQTNVAGLDDVPMESLAEMEQAIIIISTYGEGEMPDNAELFWDGLSADTAPRLEGLSYSVLALGDTSYDEFCHAGKLIDIRLEQLGAKRLNARVDCDVDFEDPAVAWVESTLPLIADTSQSAQANGASTAPEPEPSGAARILFLRPHWKTVCCRALGQRKKSGTFHSTWQAAASPMRQAMPCASYRRTIWSSSTP